jgi:poly(A) polymerase/tRNA nucleotidyltransferase (CCA-adding enzyme)
MVVPEYIIKIIKKLEKGGFEAYIVGGCVRDLLMGRNPKDWDITTKARPEEILKIFSKAKYENKFGTVLVPIKENKKTKEVVEVTTYRSEQGYSDRRHPDKIIFEESLEKDLARRDFTINAMAIRLIEIKKKKIDIKDALISGQAQLVDLFGGEKDIKKKIIRAVGEPVDRFKEDALRMMRAVRLACELGFYLEPKTERAIKKMAGSIKFIANERIRDELMKILSSEASDKGILILAETKLLNYIIPELAQTKGVGQNHHHIYDVFKHSVLSLKYCPSKDWRVRLAALLHDIGKPKTKKIINSEATFYNHELLGAKMARRIMRRLKFANNDIAKVTNLIYNHMFYYNVGEVTAASVRRLLRKVGLENINDLIDLRVADRLGSGVPKAKPYKLRHLEYMIKKVQKDPISVKMLKINGRDLMDLLGIKPGPKIGAILDVLLAEVVEDPKFNTKEYLFRRAKELDKMNLGQLRERARTVIIEKQEDEDKKLKQEFWVK